VQPDDAQWRRPSDADPGQPPTQPPGPSPGPPYPGQPGSPSEASPYPGLAYVGPPPMTPPPSGWRPPRVVAPADPRHLPRQDHNRIDDDEARARTLTNGVGILVGAILVIALCALCARAFF